MSYPLPTIRRVAIIGGGPGGLVTAKQLKAEKVFDKITIFERKEQVGGTWVYSPEVNNNPPLPSIDALKVDPPLKKKDPFINLHSPIYPNLHTNLPTHVMQFRDFDFDEATPLFPTHKDVLNYLQQFTAKFELTSHIQLNTSVIHADYDTAKKEWTLTLQVNKKRKPQTEISSNNNINNDGEDNQPFIYTESYDALVVATGHYSIPYIPDFNGIEHLKQNNISWNHSRDYRHPDIFKNKTLLIIGSGSSALDIVRETSFYATKVYHSVRTDTKQSLQAHESDANNVKRVGLVQNISKDGKIQCISNNEQQLIKVDHIIFATGYLYSYPFFPFQKDNLIIEGQTVLHTHEYLFYINNPTLAFIGLPIRIVPFPLSQSQANVIAKVFNPERKDVTLPNLERMQTIYQQQYDNQHNGDNTNRQSFVMNTEREFSYVDRLSAWAEGKYDHDQILSYQSTSLITAPLSDEWKQQRKDSLLTRKEYLGY
ncbi:hypothetical protein BJ944DRAFT_262377 [Cunninghamella echinulata]|nr:hypothetical protein BJ944DRAFT_262377 [Cunninghamella echinulata]